MKIIYSNQRDIPYGTEIESEMEMSEPEGVPVRIKQFVRRIDFGDSYTIMTHMSRGTTPAHTILVTGKKGAVEDDRRIDETETIILQSDGTVLRMEPQITKVWLNHPYQGMTPEEVAQRLEQDKPVGRCSVPRGIFPNNAAQD